MSIATPEKIISSIYPEDERFDGPISFGNIEDQLGLSRVA